MGNATSMKVVAVALVTAVSAHQGSDRCHAPIAQAVNACTPWVSKTCPQAVEMEHMAECYLRNRSHAPKTCRMAAQGAFACAAKEDAHEECVDEFGTKHAGPCMQCEVASREAEVQCTETWFEVCSHVDTEDMGAAKECFMKNHSAFPPKCQRAAAGMMTSCKHEEHMEEQHHREMEHEMEMREHHMEMRHREQEQKMEEMVEKTRQHHREMEQQEMMHDRQMEHDHEHMHPGMAAENHAEMEMHMAAEHMHHEEHMAMEDQMMTGMHMMEGMDHHAEQLMTGAMEHEMEMHMAQEDMMHHEHEMMAAAPVDTRPISKMTMEMPH